MTYGTEALAALGDATRREILERLRRGPRSVSEIAAGMPVSRPAVSQHLRVLKGAGLVSDRKDGTRRLYAVSASGLTEIRQYVEQFWDTALTGFKNFADQKQKEERT